MAITTTGRMRVKFDAEVVNALANSLGSSTVSISSDKNQALAAGTTGNKINQVWASYGRALTGAASEEIDLFDLAALDIGAGAGKDPVGGTLAILEIVGIMITNDATSVGTLHVGGATAAPGNEWVSLLANSTDIIKILPDGFFAAGTGKDPAYVVADTTNHKIKILASGGAVTYNIVVFGRNA